MVRLARIFLAASATGVAAGLLLLAASLLPLFTLDGPASGFVALSWYRLNFFGEPVVLSSLDAAMVYSVLIFSACAFSVAAGIIGTYAALSGTVEGYSERCEESCDAVKGTSGFFIELVFASSLALIMVLGVYDGILLVESAEVLGLARSFDVVTAAGTCYFGATRVSTTTLYTLVKALKLHYWGAVAHAALAGAAFAELLRRIYG